MQRLHGPVAGSVRQFCGEANDVRIVKLIAVLYLRQQIALDEKLDAPQRIRGVAVANTFDLGQQDAFCLTDKLQPILGNAACVR